MAYATPVIVLASAARTATGTSTAITPAERGDFVNLLVDVTAVSGTTPTLDLTVEWSQDGGTTWAVSDVADSFAQITAAKTTTKQFAFKAPQYRIRFTIGGTTPSFTFSVREYLT